MPIVFQCDECETSVQQPTPTEAKLTVPSGWRIDGEPPRLFCPAHLTNCIQSLTKSLEPPRLQLRLKPHVRQIFTIIRTWLAEPTDPFAIYPRLKREHGDNLFVQDWREANLLACLADWLRQGVAVPVEKEGHLWIQCTAAQVPQEREFL